MKKTYTGEGRTKKEAIEDAKKQITKDIQAEVKKTIKKLNLKIKLGR